MDEHNLFVKMLIDDVAKDAQKFGAEYKSKLKFLSSLSVKGGVPCIIVNKHGIILFSNESAAKIFNLELHSILNCEARKLPTLTEYSQQAVRRISIKQNMPWLFWAHFTHGNSACFKIKKVDIGGVVYYLAEVIKTCVTREGFKPIICS